MARQDAGLLQLGVQVGTGALVLEFLTGAQAFSSLTAWRCLMRCRLSAAEPIRDWAPADCRATDVWAFWTESLTFTMSISRRSVSIFWSV